MGRTPPWSISLVHGEGICLFKYSNDEKVWKRYCESKIPHASYGAIIRAEAPDAKYLAKLKSDGKTSKKIKEYAEMEEPPLILVLVKHRNTEMFILEVTLKFNGTFCSLIADDERVTGGDLRVASRLAEIINGLVAANASNSFSSKPAETHSGSNAHHQKVSSSSDRGPKQLKHSAAKFVSSSSQSSLDLENLATKSAYSYSDESSDGESTSMPLLPPAKVDEGKNLQKLEFNESVSIGSLAERCRVKDYIQIDTMLLQVDVDGQREHDEEHVKALAAKIMEEEFSFSMPVVVNVVIDGVDAGTFHEGHLLKAKLIETLAGQHVTRATQAILRSQSKYPTYLKKRLCIVYVNLPELARGYLITLHQKNTEYHLGLKFVDKVKFARRYYIKMVNIGSPTYDAELEKWKSAASSLLHIEDSRSRQLKTILAWASLPADAFGKFEAACSMYEGFKTSDFADKRTTKSTSAQISYTQVKELIGLDGETAKSLLDSIVSKELPFKKFNDNAMVSKKEALLRLYMEKLLKQEFPNQVDALLRKFCSKEKLKEFIGSTVGGIVPEKYKQYCNGVLETLRGGNLSVECVEAEIPKPATFVSKSFHSDTKGCFEELMVDFAKASGTAPKFGLLVVEHAGDDREKSAILIDSFVKHQRAIPNTDGFVIAAFPDIESIENILALYKRLALRFQAVMTFVESQRAGGRVEHLYLATAGFEQQFDCPKILMIDSMASCIHDTLINFALNKSAVIFVNREEPIRFITSKLSGNTSGLAFMTTKDELLNLFESSFSSGFQTSERPRAFFPEGQVNTAKKRPHNRTVTELYNSNDIVDDGEPKQKRQLEAAALGESNEKAFLFREEQSPVIVEELDFGNETEKVDDDEVVIVSDDDNTSSVGENDRSRHASNYSVKSVPKSAGSRASGTSHHDNDLERSFSSGNRDRRRSLRNASDSSSTSDASSDTSSDESESSSTNSTSSSSSSSQVWKRSGKDTASKSLAAKQGKAAKDGRATTATSDLCRLSPQLSQKSVRGGNIGEREKSVKSSAGNVKPKGQQASEPEDETSRGGVNSTDYRRERSAKPVDFKRDARDSVKATDDYTAKSVRGAARNEPQDRASVSAAAKSRVRGSPSRHHNRPTKEKHSTREQLPKHNATKTNSRGSSKSAVIHSPPRSHRHAAYRNGTTAHSGSGRHDRRYADQHSEHERTTKRADRKNSGRGSIKSANSQHSPSRSRRGASSHPGKHGAKDIPRSGHDDRRDADKHSEHERTTKHADRKSSGRGSNKSPIRQDSPARSVHGATKANEKESATAPAASDSRKPAPARKSDDDTREKESRKIEKSKPKGGQVLEAPSDIYDEQPDQAQSTISTVVAFSGDREYNTSGSSQPDVGEIKTSGLGHDETSDTDGRTDATLDGDVAGGKHPIGRCVEVLPNSADAVTVSEGGTTAVSEGNDVTDNADLDDDTLVAAMEAFEQSELTLDEAKLTASDIWAIRSPIDRVESCLSDNAMTAACNLLNRQFPEVRVYLAILDDPLALVPQADPAKDIFALVKVATRRYNFGHWLLLTKRANSTSLLVYESSCIGFPEPFEYAARMICGIPYNIDFDVIRMPFQHQPNGTYLCGYFCVAFCLELLAGNYEIQDKLFNPLEMQGHILRCFQAGKMTNFPKLPASFGGSIIVSGRNEQVSTLKKKVFPFRCHSPERAKPRKPSNAFYRIQQNE